jgi:hypothetical protein
MHSAEPPSYVGFQNVRRIWGQSGTLACQDTVQLTLHVLSQYHRVLLTVRTEDQDDFRCTPPLVTALDDHAGIEKESNAPWRHTHD